MTPSNASSPTDERHPQDDNPEPTSPTSPVVPSSIPSTPTASIPASEGYPSWLPKRPPPPAPGSTLHSLSTNVMFVGDAGPASDLPTGSAHDNEQVTPQTPVPAFTGGRKPTPRSVRIVSMQDSAGAAGSTGAGMVSRRETDQTTTRVSSFLFGLGSRIWSRATASAPAHSPTLISQTPVHPHSHSHARIRPAQVQSATQPKFRVPGLHLELLRDPSWKTRLHFYLFPLLVFAHIPIQTFFDFNAVFILIE